MHLLEIAASVAGLALAFLMLGLLWTAEARQRRRLIARIRKNQRIIDVYPSTKDEQGHPTIEETDEVLAAWRENCDLRRTPEY